MNIVRLLIKLNEIRQENLERKENVYVILIVFLVIKGKILRLYLPLENYSDISYL